MTGRSHQSAVAELLRQRGVDLDAEIHDSRAAGQSWQAIADRLTALGAQVSHDQLWRWYAGQERAAS